MIIRKLKKKDIKGFIETLSALTDVDLTEEQAIKIMKKRSTITYVGIVKRVVVATASLMIDQKFIHGGSLAGYIEDVAVNKNYQGRGFGTKIMRHLIRYAKELGCYKIMLCCKESIEPFYEKLGFKKSNSSMRLEVK
jgi:glucosamine-phosphate N-acetyltransferase